MRADDGLGRDRDGVVGERVARVELRERRELGEAANLAVQRDVAAGEAAFALDVAERLVVVDDGQVDVGEGVAEAERPAAAEVRGERRAEVFEGPQGFGDERVLLVAEAGGVVRAGQRTMLWPYAFQAFFCE